jgi:hypothetical protein
LAPIRQHAEAAGSIDNQHSSGGPVPGVSAETPGLLLLDLSDTLAGGVACAFRADRFVATRLSF